MRQHTFLLKAIVTSAVGLLVAAAASTGADAKQYGDWGIAAPVANVDSPANDGCPIEAPDGDSLYIMSEREAGGDQDIWVAHRGDDGAFGEPQILPEPVNSLANDFCPTPLRGKWLLFVSNRGGTDAYGTTACGGGDMYLTRLHPATGEWAAPRNLGCTTDGGPNGPGTEFGPSLVETDNGTLLYFSSGGAPGSRTQDIYVSPRRADGSFGSRAPVAELNTPSDDMMPNVRKDGLELVFATNRIDTGSKGSFDIWTSTRSSVFHPWSAPVIVAAVNGPGPETRPSLSWDGTRLYFGRSGVIHLSTR